MSFMMRRFAARCYCHLIHQRPSACSVPSISFKIDRGNSRKSYSTERSSGIAYFQQPRRFMGSGYPEFVPDKGELVYLGTLRKRVKRIKGFSLTTSVIGLMLQPYLYKCVHMYPLWLQFMGGSMVNFFIFLTPALLHFITKRYVTNMYYESSTEVFTLSTITLFLREKDMKFTADDVKQPDIGGPFTSVLIKGRPLLIDPSDILSRESFMKFKNFDKPLDLQLPTEKED